MAGNLEIWARKPYLTAKGKNIDKMKTNEAVKEVVKHFLEKNGYHDVAPETLIAFINGRRNLVITGGACFWLLVVTILGYVHRLIQPLPYEGYSTVSDAILILTGLLALISFFMSLWMLKNVCNVNYDKLRRIQKELEEKRSLFIDLFKRDPLKCSNVLLLSLHVKSVLFKLVESINISRDCRDFEAQATYRDKLRKYWDVGSEFVNVPSYPELFQNLQ